MSCSEAESGEFQEEFQSLFSWNLLLMDRRCSSFGRSARCFNPCFRGTCSWWSSYFGGKIWYWQVSILVFVELALDGPDVDDLLVVWIKFQSLFSWNLLLMFSVGRSPPPRSLCFNPCFRGTCSWCLYSLQLRVPVCDVSILVFVELALDGWDAEWNHERIRCFNPCFRGTCSWCPALSTSLIPHRRVSILVFVELALDDQTDGSRVCCPHVSILVFVELALDVSFSGSRSSR